MYDNLKKYLLEKGLTVDEVKYAVKIDIEQKLFTIMADLRTEIGTSTDTTQATITGILNTPNATINSKPSDSIKQLARMLRTNHRADIREIKLLIKELSEDKE